MVEQASLEKLAELHASGVLSDREYKKKRRQLIKPRRWYRGWWWKIPVICVGGFFLVNALNKAHDIGGSGARILPTCDAPDAKQAVAGAISNSPDRTTQLKLLDWSNPHLIGDESNPPERTCTALAFLNSGKGQITYRFFFPNADTNNWMVEVHDAP